MSLYKWTVRPVLFKIDPEVAHDFTIGCLAWISHALFVKSLLRQFCKLQDPRLQVNSFGLTFPNPVGLAAGFDKNCEALSALSALGFGFVEIGTVTSHAQPGNPKPRLFRLPRDLALINSFGFNNDGAETVAGRLSLSLPCDVPIGVNIGKSRTVPVKEAPRNYVESFKTLYPYGQFFIINVSSPNTPDLRTLQGEYYLEPLLGGVLRERERQVSNGLLKKPVLVKLSPDCSLQEIDGILEVSLRLGIDGIVATNTTISREELSTPKNFVLQEGGLSGLPLRDKSTKIIKYIFNQTGGRIPIIGVGGVFSAQDTLEKIMAGASLVELYTGMIYEGPFIVKNILNGILQFMEKEGIKQLTDIIGCNTN